MREPHRYGLAVVVCFVGLALQESAVSLVRLPWATPNLLLIVVVAFAVAYGERLGMLIGFSTGLAFDIVPPADHAMGRTAFALCLIGYLAGHGRRVAQRSATKPVLLVGALSALAVLLEMGISTLIGDSGWRDVSPWHAIVATVGYDMILSPFVLPGVLALARWLDRRQNRGGALDPGNLGGTASDMDESLLVR